MKAGFLLLLLLVFGSFSLSNGRRHCFLFAVVFFTALFLLGLYKFGLWFFWEILRGEIVLLRCCKVTASEY